MTNPLDSQAYPSNPTMPTATPAGYVTPTQPDTAHREPPFDTSAIASFRGNFIELIIRQVVTAIFGFFIPGSGPAILQLANWFENLPNEVLIFIRDITGIDLTTIFNGIDITNPGAVLAAIESAAQQFISAGLQQLIDAIVGGLTGGASVGNDITNVGLALINQVLTVPIGFLDSLLALFAGQQAQITAIQNNPTGASQTDDFTTATLSGRTNISGAMAISTRGPYLQTTALAADYMGTVGTPRKPATHKCGTAITIEPNMRGACRGWICGDNAMANYAAVEVYSGLDGDSVRIVTGVSPSLTVVRNEVDVAKIASATVFDIKYDPVSNKFTVLRNAQPINLDWVDAANVITHTSGKTFVGAVENAYDVNEDGFYGPAIRKQTFYDW